MKSVIAIFGFTALSQAHYRFESTFYDGKNSSAWEYIRELDPNGRDFPEFDVYGANFTCDRMAKDPFTELGTKTLDVAAGSVLGINLMQHVIHPGPLQFYLAKVPSNNSVKDFDGKGNVWFKISSDSPSIIDGRMTWPNFEKNFFNVTIPPCVQDGEYLLRVEHLALHDASRLNAAQWYMACTQLKVTGGTGTAKPSNLLAFPGSYDPNDPGIHMTVWYDMPTNYTAPGGPVFQC